MTTYFSDTELQSPDTGKYFLAEGFGDRLDEFRLLMGEPVYLNSAARSKVYNKRIGGHPRSLHVYDEPYHLTGGCCAVDVRCLTSEHRMRIIKAAASMGFSVGAASSFVHIDDRTRVLGMEQVLYLY